MGAYAPKSTIAFALLALMHAGFSDSARAEDEPGSVVKSLCNSKDVEGGYDLKLDDKPARIWVICQSEASMLASVHTLDSLYAVTMVHTAINSTNPDILSFATYELSADGAKTVDGRAKSHAVLRLSIQALRQGMVMGEFQRNPILPVVVMATRSKPLPNLLAEADPEKAFQFQFRGNFYIVEPKEEELRRQMQLIKLKAPACLVTAIDGDIKSVNFHDSGNLAIWLTWGMSADSGGNVFYATSGADDTLAGKGTVTQIRGVFVTSDLIEFYFFNSLIGIYGTFHAARIDDKAGTSNSCRPNLVIEPPARAPSEARSTAATRAGRPGRR